MKNFFVDLEYVVPLKEAEKHFDAHMEFVETGYEKGYFVTTGPKVPRTGGVIFAKAEDRAEFEAFCATDPFVIEGVAKITITEFIARRVIDDAGGTFARPK
ncbi:YciI family protein [Maritalea sp.]|jgi:uncharacterized protein YciI|uniref:YciI family protein n=1 Tax=Maritalea sp. TaxID=2003361 RepID=UPI0039E664FE